MGTVNWGRVLLGGIVSGVVINVLEAVGSMLYMEQFRAAMEAHNFSMEMEPTAMALFLVLGFIAGIGGVWIYAAIRPRFGPGPKTAAKAGVVTWLVGYFSGAIAWTAMGLYTGAMLVMVGLIGLIEIVLGTVIGAWLYKEA